MSRAFNIQARDCFFEDPFFRDSWSEFDSAVQRVLDRFDDPACIHRLSTTGHRYRSPVSPPAQSLPDSRGMMTSPMTALSAADPRYSTSQVMEKDGRFQVVLDVREFNPRNLQVRAVEDNRIVVEGKYQQSSGDGATSSWKTFSREFTLPDEADIDLVSTALSKDGMLTIRAPRKAQTEGTTEAVSKPKSNSVQSINESFDERRTADSMSRRSFKSTSSSTSSSSSSYKNNAIGVGPTKTLQSSSSFESCDSGLDSLPRDIRDRLTVNESGLSSISSSNSSCSSPAPSEAASDVSRVSTTMEFDIGNSNNTNNSRQKSEVTFNVEAAERAARARMNSSSVANNDSCVRVSSPGGNPPPSSQSYNRSSVDRSDVYPAPPPAYPFVSPVTRVPTFTPGCGSLGDKCVTVEEKDGRRTVKSERSNVIQEKNGLMESREIAAEIDDKDSRSARREAVTRIQRQHEDPEGRFKEAEKAEASDVSESCIKQLPDGTKMSVKKSCTSSSTHKSFSSSDAFDDPFFSSGFSSDFGDLRSLMGRGHSLMSQMSTDSVGSTLSGRSSTSERSNLSDQSRTSSRSSMSQRSDSSASAQNSDQSRLTGDSQFNNRLSDMRGRDRFGFPDDELMFSNRSMLSNRPSLAERFPDFSDALAEFDDLHNRHFSDFPSMRSRTSRTSNSSDEFFSSFGSRFDDKF